MKTLLIVALIVIVVAGSAVSAYVYMRRPVEPTASTARPASSPLVPAGRTGGGSR